jgi:hypothetical protein
MMAAVKSSPSALTEYSDMARIASKRRNILLHPFQCSDHVTDAIIAVQAGIVAVHQKSKSSESMTFSKI